MLPPRLPHSRVQFERQPQQRVWLAPVGEDGGGRDRERERERGCVYLLCVIVQILVDDDPSTHKWPLTSPQVTTYGTHK